MIEIIGGGGVVDPVTLGMGISVVGSIFGFGAKRKARKAAKRANELEKRRRAVANIVARRQAAANLRRMQQAAIAQSIASGGQGSVTENVLTNVGTQVGDKVARQSQLEKLDTSRNTQINNQQKYLGQAANYKAGAGLLSDAVTGNIGFKNLSSTISESELL